MAGIHAAAGHPTEGERKTVMLPSILTPYSSARTGQASTPKPTAANLRKFAETPVARRAINVVKDKIASMDWKIKVRRGYSDVDVPDAQTRMQALRHCLEEPNASDSFRTVFEQVLEDLLVGGFGALEMEATGDDQRPFHLWAVDGATIEIDVTWDGSPDKPRYAQATRRPGKEEPHSAARRRADVHPPEPAQPYPVRPRTPGGRLRDREPVSLRQPLCRATRKQLGGAVCPLAERGDAGAARPPDPLVAGRDRRNRQGAAAELRAEARGAALRRRHRRRPSHPVAGVPPDDDRQRLRASAHAARTAGRRESFDRRRDGRRGLPERGRARGQAARGTHHPRPLRQEARLARVRVQLQRPGDARRDGGGADSDGASEGRRTHRG